jgi:AcrR family transcriptional regulator
MTIERTLVSVNSAWHTRPGQQAAVCCHGQRVRHANLPKRRAAGRPRATSGQRDTAGAIVEAAERLCAAHGIEAMTIRDLARAVGVSIPVIYHHFGSRSNLLRAIVINRFSEIGAEYLQLLATLEAQPSPAIRDIIRAVLQPVNRWRQPGREASLQFYALALVCPLPEVKDTLDAGVAGFHRVVALLQQALPHLTHEDICWRLYFTIKLSHQTEWDAKRLELLSNGGCHGSDPDEALARAIAFAEAALLAPRFGPAIKLIRDRKRTRRTRR